MAKDLERPLRYAPCIRCDCPLIIFLTDHRHRFVCVRCHEQMARNAARSIAPCSCADIQTCEKCYKREEFLRYRRRTMADRARWQRDYRMLNQEKVAEHNRRYRQRRNAKRQALKEAQANDPATPET